MQLPTRRHYAVTEYKVQHDESKFRFSRYYSAILIFIQRRRESREWGD